MKKHIYVNIICIYMCIHIYICIYKHIYSQTYTYNSQMKYPRQIMWSKTHQVNDLIDAVSDHLW